MVILVGRHAGILCLAAEGWIVARSEPLAVANRELCRVSKGFAPSV
jgi:hypothetical protein